MSTVLLVVHLLVAIFLVALILLQRSGGGALDGLGGGSGAGNFLTARGTGNLLTRLTAITATPSAGPFSTSRRRKLPSPPKRRLPNRRLLRHRALR